MRTLVTGATGYVGSQLVPRLLEAGHHVDVLARAPGKLAPQPWAHEVGIHQGDLTDRASLEGAFDDVDLVYYLVHSMGSGHGFQAVDRLAASNVVEAAEGIDHLVYLGGLLPREHASEHLASRAEVGAILRGGLPTTEFRAGPIIGAGSGSFEMVRHLTDRLPVMVAPRWIDNQVQPIAIQDVLSYLVAAPEVGPLDVVEIGGPDRPTFRQMMEIYARVRGLNRLIVKVPVLTPHLASLWVGLVTPIPNSLATPLIEGIVEPVLADTTLARKAFPEIEPVGYRAAVEAALAQPRPAVAR